MKGVKDPDVNSRGQLLDTLRCVYVAEYDVVILKMSIFPVMHNEFYNVVLYKRNKVQCTSTCSVFCKNVEEVRLLSVPFAYFYIKQFWEKGPRNN